MNISSVSTINYSNNLKNKFNSNENPNNQTITSNPSFKKGAQEAGWLTKIIAKTYGKFMLNNNTARKFSKKLTDIDKNDASRHFQVVGSAVTSSAYMAATLKNKDIEKKNGRTLAINQGLGFVIPTIAAYTVDSLLRNFNKTLEYAYSGKVRKRIEEAKMTQIEADAAREQLSRRLKGFRALMPIVTFTMIYRYVVPVAITPLANKMGNWLNAKIDKKEVEKQQTKVA